MTVRGTAPRRRCTLMPASKEGRRRAGMAPPRSSGRANHQLPFPQQPRQQNRANCDTRSPRPIVLAPALPSVHHALRLPLRAHIPPRKRTRDGRAAASADTTAHARFRGAGSVTAAAMVYISNGQVLGNQNRAPWSLSSITDFFWAIADFVVLFFQSIIQPDLRRKGNTSSSYSRYDDGRGPPGNPRRRMGRINHFGGGPSPPPMAGGG